MNRLPLCGLVLLFAIEGAFAAISVAGNGSATQTFDTLSPVSEWSTQFIPGGAGSITTREALDAQVQTNAASAISNALATGFTGGCCAKLAIWETNTAFTQVLFPQTAKTRPTGVA